MKVGGEVPQFAREYASKFGETERVNGKTVLTEEVEKLGTAHTCLMLEATRREIDLVKEVLFVRSDPSFPKKRFGQYLSAFNKGDGDQSKLGSVLQVYDKENLSYGGLNFQSMRNCKIAPMNLKTGETHVSIGCGDFSQLLFTELVGDTDEHTHFHVVDLALVSITRCKVLYEMLSNQASSRSILQVWFSSAWSENTLKEFLASCSSLLNSGANLTEAMKGLIMYWMSMSSNIIKDGCFEWAMGVEGVRIFRPCANLRYETDRIDYARYLFTGYIFEESEESLTTGNRTMFAIPMGPSYWKYTSENFYFILDILKSEALGFVYTGSLKRSTDKFMVQQMEKLRGMVNTEQGSAEDEF